MEFGTFSASNPESAPGRSPRQPESIEKKKNTNETKEKKKKSGGGTAALAEIATDNVIRHDQRQGQVVESIWQKIKGEGGKPKQSEAPLFGIRKPDVEQKTKQLAGNAGEVVVIRPDVVASGSQTENDVAPVLSAESSEAAEHKTSRGAETPAEAKERAELRQAGQDFAELRLQAADGELHELPLDRHDTPEAAEAAAGIALMRSVQENLRSGNGMPLAEAVDAAGRSVVASMEAALPAENVAEQVGGDAEMPAEPGQSTPEETPGQPGNAETEPGLPDGSEFAERTAETSAEAPLLPPAGPPGRPPHEPPNFPPGEPPFGSNFGGPYGGHGGPHGPNFNGIPAPNPNLIPTAAANTIPVMPVAEAFAKERAAGARGVLVGGIAGYFIGRHRGRKQGRRGAEKQFAPVQGKLEKQVKTLQETIASKEQQIRQVAHEKVGAVLQSQERRRFIDKLLRPNAESAFAAKLNAEKAAALTAAGEVASAIPGVVAAEQVAAAATRGAEQNPGATQPQAGELYSRETSPALQPQAAELLIGNRYQQEFNPSPGAGRFLAEATLAAVAAPLVIDRLKSEKPMSEKPSEQSKIIPFDKKAENFTHQELMQTAEKVKVQGVSLKEMAELGRLDERSLRSVVQEYLEGGNVGAAVAREVKEKEAKFEQDPRMRNSAASGHSQSQGQGGTNGVGGGFSDGDAANGAAAAEAANANMNPASEGPRPVLDAATRKEIRDKQLTRISSFTLVIAVIIVILALLTR